MLLQLHPGLMIWTIVTFLSLVVVLRLVAWKPILAMLEAREKKIREDIENAAANREEADKLLSDVRAQLEKTRREANEIVAQARSAAEKVREETIAQAKADSQQIIQRAKEEIQLEKEKTAQALREQFADLAVNAASKIIGQKLKPEDHIDIIKDVVGKMN
jgi:F-type H+-transporting ATPase subunit b